MKLLRYVGPPTTYPEVGPVEPEQEYEVDDSDRTEQIHDEAAVRVPSLAARLLATGQWVEAAPERARRSRAAAIPATTPEQEVAI